MLLKGKLSSIPADFSDPKSPSSPTARRLKSRHGETSFTVCTYSIEFERMNNDDDTLGWLGLPSPLQMYRQHCRLLENEIQELNAQLRKARADVFGISQMLLETQAKNSEFAGYLRERGAEAAAMRKQISDLTTSNYVNKREAEELRRIVNEMRPRPTTIV